MADRIVVLGANPGRVVTVVDNRLPRPRDYRSPEVLALVDRLHDIITHAELPDAPVTEAAPAAFQALEPLPDARVGEIVGILEYLDARGGRDDLVHIAAGTHFEFGRIITVVKAAEMLDFVDTPKRQVILESNGQRFVKAAPEARKAIWSEQLLKMRLFRQIHDVLSRDPHGEVDADIVQEAIIVALPNENYERMFETFVRWARYGNLFTYDEGRCTLALQERT